MPPVTPDQWLRVKQHFAEAVAEDPSDGRAWQARLAAEDQDIRAEVEALLESHRRAARFLDGPLLVDPVDLLDAGDPPADDSEGLLAPGTRIGDYEIRRQVGRGGMGVVYLAHDVNLSRPVALKALPPLASHDNSLLTRLRREAQAAAAISHPGVAMVYAFLETRDGPFIASEFIQGRTLRQELQHGPFDHVRALRVAAEITSALCAAHDAHVVHRDLKPENVLITESGAVKVIDFGIARLAREGLPTLTAAGLIHGTPGYMAPEQLVGAPADARSDLYALGIVLGEMVLGRHPLERGTRGMPVLVEPIVRRCLQSDPADRYQSARDLLHDLERASFAAATSSPATGVSPLSGAVRGPMFWWQFHLAVSAVVYWGTAAPAWYARELIGGRTGLALFFAGLTALLLASILRLHLLFISRTSPDELVPQLQSERRWIVGADIVLALSLLSSGILVSESRMSLGVLLVALGVGCVVAALFIEPVTTRAAVSPRQG
jgi:serine/threonine-protein kinase